MQRLEYKDAHRGSGMDWTEKIFAYCERAGDPQFWAEPFNAISNLAFLIAAVLAAFYLARTADAATRRVEWTLVVIVFIIGVGSFLFHTTATRWASVADTAPIGVFMIAYLGYAMRRFLGASYVVVAVVRSPAMQRCCQSRQLLGGRVSMDHSAMCRRWRRCSWWG
jgi:hypothetical protein